MVRVIETLLGFVGHNSNGQPSFACPICGGFETSIHTAHNLARCFACRQNFNPIELVMHQLKINFVDSVQWLKNRIPAAPGHQNPSICKASNAQPTAIGDILSNMMPKIQENKTDAKSLDAIVERISRLEDNLRYLYRVVSKL
jgi:hypothetical protein